MNSIILAAGMGTRLKNLTSDKPKALVQVAGKTLLEYVITMAEMISSKKIIIVTGSRHDLVRAFLEKIHCYDKIALVENINYQKGNLYSLQAALPLVKEDFFLFNVDHVFSKQFMIEALNLSRRTEYFTVFCDRQKPCVFDQMKVVEKNGQLRAIGKKLTEYNTGYTGLDYCPTNALANFLNAVREADENVGVTAVKEDAINRMANPLYGAVAADISGFDWFEVDTQEDLALAENMIYQNRNNWL